MVLHNKNFSSTATKKEKWYGTAHDIQPVSEELLKKCETCELVAELHLPIPNEFIPNDFRLFSSKETVARPQIPTKIQVRT